MQNSSCDLAHCFLCRHCMPEWAGLTILHKKTMFFKKGKALFREGEPVQGIFFLYSGAVKIHAPWTDGREMIIRFTKAGEVAGHRGLAGNALYPVSATALEDTVACFITNDFLELSLKANPNFTYTLMHLYAAELQKAEQKMRDLIHMDVKGRIAGALLEIADTFGTTAEGYFGLTVSRQDIASLAGTTYETVFKLFNDWIGQGIIKTLGKAIRIDKPELLTRMAARERQT
jgi:CRP-like cAMP-binding protein